MKSLAKNQLEWKKCVYNDKNTKPDSWECIRESERKKDKRAKTINWKYTIVHFDYFGIQVIATYFVFLYGFYKCIFCRQLIMERR